MTMSMGLKLRLCERMEASGIAMKTIVWRRRIHSIRAIADVCILKDNFTFFPPREFYSSGSGKTSLEGGCGVYAI